MAYTEKERTEDFEWFLQNYEELYKKYGYCHIGIRHKKILGIYESYEQAISILSNQYELGEYIIQKCNGDESGYTNYVSSWQLVGV